jgi:hypothetical protein
MVCKLYLTTIVSDQNEVRKRQNSRFPYRDCTPFRYFISITHKISEEGLAVGSHPTLTPPLSYRGMWYRIRIRYRNTIKNRGDSKQDYCVPSR